MTQRTYVAMISRRRVASPKASMFIVTLRDYPQDDEGRLLPDDEVRGSI
jgi:hypothetical protein